MLRASLWGMTQSKKGAGVTEKAREKGYNSGFHNLKASCLCSVPSDVSLDVIDRSD